MWLAVMVILPVGVGLVLWSFYDYWQRMTEKERFLLGMKKAATPDQLKPHERARLDSLRAPWWAVWRWSPSLWRQLQS